MTNTLAGNTNEGFEYYNDKKEFIQNSAAIKDSEISFFEGFSSSVDRDISEAKGAVIGGTAGAKDTVIGIVRIDEKLVGNNSKTLNDQQVNGGRYPTGYPAWKTGTLVTDRVVRQPEKMRMVIDEGQYINMQ